MEYDETNTAKVSFSKSGRHPAINFKLNREGETLDFAVWKNDKKGNEKAPDYTGTVTFGDGYKMRVALWKRNDGFLSGQLSEPDADYQKEEKTESNDFDDDVPF